MKGAFRYSNCVRLKQYGVRGIRKLSPASAGYGFCQDGMNFFQKTAGLHTPGE